MFNFLSANGFLLYVIIAAGFLHASLQLPLANLLHIGTHALGRGRSTHIVPLSLLVIVGHIGAIAGMMALAVGLIALVGTAELANYMIGGLTLVAGLAIMLAYFRPSPGARMWLPPGLAHKLYAFSEQPSTPQSYAHAAVSGLAATWAELLFSLPLVLCTVVIAASPGAPDPFVSFAAYATAASLPLLLAALLLATGSSPARMLRSRVESKRFWQFFLGFVYICFGLYIASGQYSLAGGAA